MGYTDNKNRKRRDKGNGDAKSIVGSSLVGLAVSGMAFAVLWIVATFLAYSLKDPDSVIEIAAFCSVYASAFAGGLVASNKNKDSGVICAALCGGMLAVALLFVSFAFGDEYSSGYRLFTELLIRLGVVAASLLGGMLGVYQRPKHRPRRR